MFSSGVAEVTIPAHKTSLDIKITPSNDNPIEANENITPTILDDPTSLTRYLLNGAASTATANLAVSITGLPKVIASPSSVGTGK